MERELVDTAVRFQRNMVLGAEPGTWFFLALLFSVLFLVWQYRRFRTVESRLARWALMGTRLLLLAGVLLFLLKPTVLKQRLAVLKPTLPILVDTSRSMSLPYDREGEATRLDTARDLVSRLMAREGSEAMDIQLTPSMRRSGPSRRMNWMPLKPGAVTPTSSEPCPWFTGKGGALPRASWS
jgi:hypothetical protein